MNKRLTLACLVAIFLCLGPGPLLAGRPDPFEIDLTGDQVIDGLDLSVFAGHFGQSGKYLAADLNGDEVVDGGDLAFLAAEFGKDLHDPDGEEVCICHIPPGNPDNAHTICIGSAAVHMHMTKHGDFLGLCEGEQLCADETDDDLDGLTDCADDDCLGQMGASGEVCEQPEATCDDGFDNDADGNVDCEDLDCAEAVVCQPEICDDGIDNNGNELIDCDDPECAEDAACQMEICDDGVDNDGDMAVDCDDTDCAQDPACVTAEICDDGIDNDGDLLVDCDDPDCAEDAACTP